MALDDKSPACGKIGDGGHVRIPLRRTGGDACTPPPA
jgi:hypothetical protein